MEQKPVPGQDALVPPDAVVAQQYLDEARAVAVRRAGAVDRRALARLEIVNAVVTATFITAYAWILQSGASTAMQVLLFAFLLWSQISTGMAQRSGMQWRWSKARIPLLVIVVIIVIALLAVFWSAIWDERLPVGLLVLPGALALVGLGGHATLRLVRASGDPRPPRALRASLSPTVRGGTICVGLALGLLILLGAVPDDGVRAVLLLLVVLPLLVWIVAARSAFGLPAIGAAWRWPHVLAFAISGSALLTLTMLDVSGTDVGTGVTVGAGVAVVALLAAVSFVPGRDPRG